MQALRDTKALYDEGILTEAEFRAKKAELLAAKAYGVAPPPPPPPPQKTKLSLSDATFTAPLTSLGDDAVPSMVDDTVPRFQSRRGLGSKRGWDVRVACDPEDAADICAVVNAHYAGDFAGPDAFRSGPGPTVTEATVARQLESPRRRRAASPSSSTSPSPATSRATTRPTSPRPRCGPRSRRRARTAAAPAASRCPSGAPATDWRSSGGATPSGAPS